MAKKKRILLLRSNVEDKSDPYETALKEHDIYQIPVLQFDFINQDELLHKLNSPKDYNAIVFTSVRGVEAVSKVKNQDSLDPGWFDKKCYVVGETTHAKVLETFPNWTSARVLGKEAGKASNLAVCIAEHESRNSLLLFPCGTLKRNELEEGLKKHDISLDSVISYATKPKEDLRPTLDSLRITELMDFVVFFSPSGVKSAYEILEEKSITDFTSQRTKIIAIGPTTAEPLKNIISNVLVASKPNAESVAALIRENS